MSFYTHKNGICFRKLDKEDLPQLLDLKNESWFGTVHTACLNSTDQERWFEKISNDKTCLYFIAYELEAQPLGLYGIVNMDPINQSCDFTHSVYKDHRGKGLGKKTLRAGIDMSFEIFNMRRIDTWILSNNHAEIGTTKSIGFVEEGSKRQAVYKCGEYLDCKLFGLLRSEWDKSPEVISLRAWPENSPSSGLCNISYRPKNAKTD
jgi:RimJ/RimL family protein N-acetyltransferase